MNGWFTFHIENSSYWTSARFDVIHCQSETQALIIDAAVYCAAIAVHLCNSTRTPLYSMCIKLEKDKTEPIKNSMLSVFVVPQKFLVRFFFAFGFFLVFSKEIKRTKKNNSRALNCNVTEIGSTKNVNWTRDEREKGRKKPLQFVNKIWRKVNANCFRSALKVSHFSENRLNFKSNQQIQTSHRSHPSQVTSM